jgi:hypothetical protein
MLEEFQAARVGEAQLVWDFLGETETALVPLDFSPLHSGDPMQEVNSVLPLLNSAGAKIQKLEEVIGGQLEVEGRALAEAVWSMCWHASRAGTPQLSLEPVAQGPVMKTEEATWASVQETVKLVAARFERWLEDA